MLEGDKGHLPSTTFMDVELENKNKQLGKAHVTDFSETTFRS